MHPADSSANAISHDHGHTNGNSHDNTNPNRHANTLAGRYSDTESHPFANFLVVANGHCNTNAY